MNRLVISVLGLLALAAGSTAATAADLRLLISNGMKSVMDDAGPLFERKTGHKLSIRYGGSAILQEAIARGDAFDVVVNFAPNLDASTRLGKIDSTSRVEIARSGLGVVIRADLPKPNISTVAGFRRAILDAPSIAYASRGASGRHFLAVCDRLGITEQVKAKSKPGGTSLLLMTTTAALLPAFDIPLQIDPQKGLAPVAQLAVIPCVLAVNAKNPAKTFPDFLAMEKAPPRPGRQS